MNKKQFIRELENRLLTIKENERQEAISYYLEMIEDSMEEGKTEKEAVSELGTIDEIVKKISENAEINYSTKNTVKTDKSIVFAVLSPFILTGFVLVASLFLVLYSVIITLYAFGISFFAIAIACAFEFCINLSSVPSYAFFELGIGICSLGAGILLMIGTTAWLKCCNRFTKTSWVRFVNWIKGGLGE